MSTSKPRNINGLLLLAAVVGLLLSSAAPASASHLTIAKSASQGIGQEWGPSVDEFCSELGLKPMGAQFETTYYLITENVNYVVYDTGSPVAHFSGLITMNAQHGDMVAAPQGASPGECTGLPVLPAPVPLTRATVSDASAANLDCRQTYGVSTDNSYRRVDSNFKLDFFAACTITGNTSGLTAKRNVWLQFDVYGTQNTSGYLKGITHSVAISGNGH